MFRSEEFISLSKQAVGLLGSFPDVPVVKWRTGDNTRFHPYYNSLSRWLVFSLIPCMLAAAFEEENTGYAPR